MSNADLIARLERAESGSRELDAEMSVFAPPVACACSGHCNTKQANYEGCCIAVPHYTTSLDAIVALIGEKLPGHTWDAGARFYGEDWDLSWARVYPHRNQSKGTGNQKAATTALALCIALLRALDQNGGEHG